MKKKIIARIFGGIGNQLFIYCSARRLALINNAELVIDDVSGFENDTVYQRIYQLDKFSISCRKATSTERLEPFSRPRRKIYRWWNDRLPFEKRNYITQKGFDYDERLISLRPNGTVYLEGYWQSEDYFKDVENIIRQDLVMKSPGDVVNSEIAKKMQHSCSVSVHVRFFDPPKREVGNNVKTDYYEKAIEVLEQQLLNPHYYIFSDRPEDAKSYIRLPDSRITLIKHNQGELMSYADLWLMTHCQNFIIANSTFSWFGAWLSDFPHKSVYAPDPARFAGTSFWHAKGLLPKNWNLI